jgi:hypothetical protein
VNIWRIEKDPKLSDIVIVTAEDGCVVRYRMGDDGVLRPGRVWACFGKGLPYTVTLFIPLPDGPPELLAVHSRSSPPAEPGRETA